MTQLVGSIDFYQALFCVYCKQKCFLFSLLMWNFLTMQGATDIVQLLLKKGAAISGKDKSSMTCIHWAVMSSNVRYYGYGRFRFTIKPQTLLINDIGITVRIRWHNNIMTNYRILHIIRSEKVLLFHIFTFILEKILWLPTFTSFHSIHMQKFTKKLSQLQSNLQKRETFKSWIISSVRYVVKSARPGVCFIRVTYTTSFVWLFYWSNNTTWLGMFARHKICT